MASTPYDPYIPSGGSPAVGSGRTPAVGGSSANPQQGDQFTEMQSNLDATVAQMGRNIEAIQQRGDNLQNLQNKTENLADSSQRFRKGANMVRKKMWWKDVKMRFCLIAGVLILILIIVLPVVLTVGKN